MPCSEGMRKCKSGCLHRESVNDYRDERMRQEVAVENGGWRERDGDPDAEPLITFKRWLTGRRGAGRGGQT